MDVRLLAVEALRVDPADLELATVVHGRVAERLEGEARDAGVDDVTGPASYAGDSPLVLGEVACGAVPEGLLNLRHDLVVPGGGLEVARKRRRTVIDAGVKAELIDCEAALVGATGHTVTYIAELASDRFARIYLWNGLEYEQKSRDRQLFNGIMLGITGLLGSGRTELALTLFGVLASLLTGLVVVPVVVPVVVVTVVVSTFFL